MAKSALQKARDFTTGLVGKVKQAPQVVGSALGNAFTDIQKKLQQYPTPYHYLAEKISNIPTPNGSNIGQNIRTGMSTIPQIPQAAYQGVIKPTMPIVKQYIGDTARAAIDTGKSALKLTPAYDAYRNLQQRPISPMERIGNIVNTGFGAANTAYRMSGAAPITGAVFGGIKGLRESGGDINQALISAQRGVAEQPFLGETLTSNQDQASLINLAAIPADIFLRGGFKGLKKGDIKGVFNIAKEDIPNILKKAAPDEGHFVLKLPNNKILTGLTKDDLGGWIAKLEEGGHKYNVGVSKTPGGMALVSKSKQPLSQSTGGVGGVTPTPTLPQPVKSLEKPLEGIQLPQAGGIKGSSLPSSITQVANPTDPYFNINRLNVSPQVKQAIKTVVQESKPEIEKVIGKTLTNKEVIDTANTSAKIFTRAVTRDQTKAWEAALLKTRQVLANQAESGQVTQEYIDALVTVKSLGTDIGRKLQSFGIGADSKELGAKQVILEAVLKATNNADEVLKQAQGVDFNDFQQSSAFYREFIKPRTEEWADALRYNAMLSSPNTHISNIASNIQGTGIITPIEKTITGTFDWLGSTVTSKPRKYFAGEGIEYAKGYWSNIGKAAKNFGDVLSGKKLGEITELHDIPLATKGAGKFTENVLKFPQRALAAMDSFFTTLSSSGIKRSLEYRVGKGVKTKNIDIQALNEARYRLFNAPLNRENESALLRAVDYIPQKILEAKNSTNPVVRTMSKMSFPFVRIAVNLFKQGIEYSPAGIVTIPGAKEKLPQFTKAFMGTMVGLGAATLASSNRITWAKPSGENQRKLWDQAGMQEYSIKVGDKWVSYTKLHPLLAFNLATVAAVKQAIDKKKIDDTTSDTILTSLANVMRFYGDQSYVKNIGDFISSVSEGQSAIPKQIANYTQQFVPFRAFLGWLARTVDPVQRGVTPDADTLTKQMQYFFMQIPGLRQTLPAKTGIGGEPIENKNRFLNAVSPVKITQTDEKYQKAYEIQSLEPKAKEAKQQAIQFFKQGNVEEAKKLKDQYKFKVSKEDVKRYDTSRKSEAIKAFIKGDEETAKKIKTENKLTITKQDVAKAAKKEAVRLYKLGLVDEAKALKTKYGFVVLKSEIE